MLGNLAPRKTLLLQRVRRSRNEYVGPYEKSVVPNEKPVEAWTTGQLFSCRLTLRRILRKRLRARCSGLRARCRRGVFVAGAAYLLQAQRIHRVGLRFHSRKGTADAATLDHAGLRGTRHWDAAERRLFAQTGAWVGADVLEDRGRTGLLGLG